MPPPHAQPPGSNKSQRGRESSEETVTMRFCVRGREMGCVEPASCSQARSPHLADLVQCVLLLLPNNHPRDHLSEPGRQRKDLLFSHPPSFPSVRAPRVCQDIGGWDRAWQTGLLEMMSTLSALCQSPLQCVMSWAPPRLRLHLRPTASASKIISSTGTRKKKTWKMGVLVLPRP